MKFATILSFLLFITLSLAGQRMISGNLIDSATGKPIVGGSVFLSNTSIGTVSDGEGKFRLAGLPDGRYDLIITSIGYNTYAESFTSDQLPISLNIKMTVKVRELQNVTVEPFVEEGWSKWGTLFTETFIGSTNNAKKCKLKNHKAIKFRYFKKSNRLIAFSDEPLIIENNALGYKISYQLEDFEIDMKQGSSVYAGYPFFEDQGKKRANRWLAARDKAFYGSVLHFMRSLYKDSLIENGFEVRRMARVYNTEKERIRKFYRPFGDRDTTLPEDSFRYYETVMRARDYVDHYGKELLTADSLVMNEKDGYKQVYFQDFIYITYKHETDNQVYLSLNYSGRKPKYQSSHLFLVNGQSILIDEKGNHYPAQELFLMGYWSWSEKLADMLPLEYVPGNFK